MKVEIIVHPNSRQPRIETDLTGMMHVYVAEPALRGKANRAVSTALAKHFGVKKNQVVIRAGARSKRKVVELVGFG